MCQIADIPHVDDAAAFVLERLSRGRIKGSLVPTFVVTSIQVYCGYRENVKKAAQVSSYLLNTAQRPATPPSLSTFLDVYARQQAQQIAAQLSVIDSNWSAQRVRGLVGSLCLDMRNGLDAVSTRLAPALPRATLNQLGAVNGIVSATLRCRTPLTAPQVDYLSGAAFNYLVANTYAADYEPPSVRFTRIHGVRYTDHLTRVTVNWESFDRLSEISGLVLFKSVNGGRWQFVLNLRPTPAAAIVSIPEGSTYQLAVQATDTRGNRSAWAYSGVGQA